MSELIKTLLSLSISGTVLILILVLLRPLYKDRISKSWQYYIWLVVVARLLCQWTPDIIPAMNISISNIFQKTAFENYETNIVPDTIQSNLKEISADISSKADNATEDTQTKSIKFLQLLLDIVRFVVKKIHIIWLAVAVLLFTRKITIYQSFIKYVSASSTEVNDISVLERFGKAVEQNYIRGTIRLYINDVISSPMLIGFFNPRIVLTRAVFSSETSFHYTILHELVHYKRMDMLYKWLVQIVVCLHWFNPFVYLMEREISRACELSCDEIVIKKLDAAAKRKYGDTLLDAMRTGGSYKNIPTSVTLNESKELLKERLEAIMKYKEKSKAAKAFTFVFTILLCISAVTISVYKTPSSVNASANNIIYENGTYYVLVKGASESDKPSGGGTSVSICLVKKDSYSGISPFCNMAKFVDKVKKQCKNMLKNKRCTEDDADIFIEVAKEIQSLGKSGQKRFPKLNKESIKLEKGGTFSLKMANTDKKAIWTSNNENIVTVDKNGKVLAKKAGKAKITAKIGRIMYRCKASVANKTAKKTYSQKDYAQQGITKQGSAYYYNGKRIRIFMDLKADNSFAYFNYDKKGTVDLRIKRVADDSITTVEYITKEEADSILSDMDITDVSDTDKQYVKPKVNVSRLLKTEVPASVADTISSCSSSKWYVISDNDCKYIYYNGLPRDYAFKLDMNTDSAKIKIYDIGFKTGNYVLLAVRQNVPLNIYYNDKKVSLNTK